METSTFSPKKLVFKSEEELHAFYGFCDIVLKAHGMSAKNNVDYFLAKLEDLEDATATAGDEFDLGPAEPEDL